MKYFVLEASVTLAWVIDRATTPYAARIRQLLLTGERAVVPPLWRLEIANAFLVAERRGLLTTADTPRCYSRFTAELLDRSRRVNGASFAARSGKRATVSIDRVRRCVPRYSAHARLASGHSASSTRKGGPAGRSTRALDFGFLFQVIRILLQFFRNGWKRRPTLPITLQQRGGNFQSSHPIMHGELMWMAL